MTAATLPLPALEERQRVVQRLEALGAVAVVRLNRADAVLPAARALHAGGISAIEVTMTVPDALRAVEQLAREAQADDGDGLLVGVGSVLDAETARRAVDAGARFVVSPVFEPDVLTEAQRMGAAVLAGAFTPTEILRAHRAGADMVKVFPSEALGPAFIRGVRAPMPFLKLCPTGGVTPENAGDWIRAGAAAVGLGGALVDPKLVDAGEFAELTDRARRTVQAVMAARGGAA